ncbi:MAG: hypothetical protein QXH80_01115, partial [Candidatus Nanoarchaeia archaeon]
MKKQTLKLMMAALLIAVSGIAVFAAPGTISYRGRLLDSTGNVVNSAGLSMKFLFYSDLTGGTLLYQDWNDGIDGRALVPVQDGLYVVVLGDDNVNHGGATYTSLTDALNADDSIYLEIIIDGNTLTPREKLQAVPYAINAGSSSGSNATRELDNLQNVAINTSLLPGADNSIDLGSAAKSWKDVYIDGKITDGTNETTVANIVTKDGTQTLTNKTINPANNSITLSNAKILIGTAGNVAAEQTVSGDINIDNTGTATIQPNSVALGTDTTGAYVSTIANATNGGTTITGSGGETANVTVAVNVDNTGIEISANSLQLKDGGVTSAKIANGTIVNEDIADATIQNAKLVNNSVTVTAGDGLKDGGAVALGSSVTINVDPGDGIQISSDKVAVDSTVVRTSGDQTINGTKTFGSIPVLPGTNTTSDNQAVRKAYVDNLVNGLSWKDAVRAATTANITLSGEQTIDGVALTAGDRVLVKNQTTASQNGIYVVATGAWSRAQDMDESAEVKAAAMYVTDGTTQSGTAWVCNNTGDVIIGTTNISFVQFSGTGTYTAGNGLTLTGNEFAVGTTANCGITANPDDIQVNVDDSTIEINSNALRIKDLGVTTAKINTGAVTTAKIQDDAVTTSKIIDDAITNAKMADNSVNTAEIVDNAITNAKMADNSVNTAEIVNNAVTTDKINNSAVTTDKINDSAVTSAKIADGTIVNDDISATAAITDNKLAQLTTANKVAGSAVELNSTGGLENSSGLKIKQATGSGLTVDANGVRITVCNKLDATAPPTKNNDSNDTSAPNGIGYSVGSIWVDVTNKKQYVCVDNTDGAAVWRLTSPLENQTMSGGSYVNRSLPG